MKDQSKTKQTLIQKKSSLDKASEYAENIIDTVREPLIVLDQDLREEALVVIGNHSDSKYDPKVADAYLKLFREKGYQLEGK